MIVDSSVLVAIVLEEPGHEIFFQKIAEASIRRMSAASLLETSIVVNREKGLAGIAILDQFILSAGIEIVAFTEEHARLAFQAHQRFGKGRGHPAQLNILDCCTYALATQTGEPVLFKGADFDKTDIAIAM